MKVGIFQFNGCDKCFNESMLLGGDHQITRVQVPKEWKGGELDVAVITGHILPKDKPIIEKIKHSSGRIVAYGSCATAGGPYGLTFQRGNDVHPAHTFAGEDTVDVDGCLGEVEELEAALWGKQPNGQKLCAACPRRSTCEFLDEVVRQVEIEEDDDVCFNDKGFLCSGYVARACKESCVSSGTPCRGCKPSIKDSGFRMVGMFATLMANVEVATEATGKGGTDKLADEPDALTRSVPDVSGSFFRFVLPASRMPIGKSESTGNMIGDIMVGRPIEEVPLITGLIGGSKSISFTIDSIEAYEKSAGIEVSEKTKGLRKSLIDLEKGLQGAIDDLDVEKYKTITDKIRKIAGNMNLSNLFYGGFKVPIEDENEFDVYKSSLIEITPGEYESGSVKYTLDQEGIITEFSWTVEA